MTNSDELPNHSRYQFLREIGEGGMGIVFHARDRFLQRDLAIKVLATHHASRGDYVDRFIEEAQIAGQLQHPGIVPIHDIGKLDNDIPFFAMKLVKGKTLQELLDNRTSLEDQQQRWIDIFSQVCQAVAFAHSKGVIHRDLKPSNVMIGRFDEVQVMDWGLAKINLLPQASPAVPDTIKTNLSVNISQAKIDRSISFEQADNNLPQSKSSENTEQQANFKENALTFDRSVIQSIRYSPLDESSDSIDPATSELMAPLSLTSYGQVIGSLAYMPPEQAQGNIHTLDSRADVFALGAILTHILAGKAPYIADEKMDRLRMAARAELAPCWERLSTTPFDAELIALCKWCLSADAKMRPQDASVVADHIAKYRAQIVENSRQAELDRAAAEARLQETIRSNQIDRKRRQWAWAATLAGCALVLFALASASWIAMQQSAVNLAKSNEQNATLERELERVARWEQSRLTMQQSLLPIQLGLDQVMSSETIPLMSELNRLNNQLKSAYEVFLQAPLEIQREFNLDSLRKKHALQVEWAEACNGPQTELGSNVLRILNVTESNLPKATAENIQESLTSLPRWARDRARTELLKSIHQNPDVPRSLTSALSESPWEVDFWTAIEKTDIDRLIRLANAEELKSQPLAIQLELAAFLVANGANWATDRAISEMNWTLIYPTSVKDSRGLSLGVTDDGWIVSKNPANLYSTRLEATIPAQQIGALRLETFVGSSMIEDANWIIEPHPSQLEKPLTSKARGMRTSPTIDDRRTRSLLGPGVDGTGPENCNIRELVISRESSEGDLVKLKFNRFFTAHTTMLGNEADFAIDNDQSSSWALGHREGQQLCSTIFQADSLQSWQCYEKLVCNIEAGNPSLWLNTSLGRFRLYYSIDSVGTVTSPASIAVKILEDLNQRHPGNTSILDIMAKANLETGTVAKMNRQASFALASIATVIDPNNSQTLRFLADTVLALKPNSDSSDYKRLLSQIDTFENDSVANEVRTRVAKYQLNRGDQMHKLLPEAAFDAYQESHRLDSANFQRHGRLAYELLRRKRMAEAVEMARLGVQQPTIDPENLLLFANIALATNGSAEAFPVFENWFDRVPTLKEIDDLQFVRARICFQADQIDQGIAVVKSLEGKVGESPNVWKDAAVSIARSKRREDIPWLLESLARNDKEYVSYTDDMVIVRDRKAAWGIAAMAAIDLGETICLERVLLEKSKRFPAVWDDVIRTADSFFLERVPPYGPCVSHKNAERLFDMLQRIQPDEPRWDIRSAFLDWKAGRSSQAWSKLGSLPIELDANGDALLLASPERNWQAFARVVAAVMRLVDADRDPSFEKWRTSELAEAEISVAQKCLGRVPEGDRDLAEWMWWETVNHKR